MICLIAGGIQMKAGLINRHLQHDRRSGRRFVGEIIRIAWRLMW